MNGDAFLVHVSDTAAVAEAIRRVGGRLQSERETLLPTPAFPSRPDIRYGKKRTLLLLGNSQWTAVTEGGEVADEFLARGISLELATETVVLGLYETANAWGRRLYEQGVATYEQFEPMDAFADDAVEVEGRWSGNATRECRLWLQSVGWTFDFPWFSQLIAGDLPSGVPDTALVRVALM